MRIENGNDRSSLSQDVEEDEEECEDDGNDGYYNYNEYNYDSQNNFCGNSKERKNKFVAQNHVRTAVSNPGKNSQHCIEVTNLLRRVGRQFGPRPSHRPRNKK